MPSNSNILKQQTITIKYKKLVFFITTETEIVYYVLVIKKRKYETKFRFYLFLKTCDEHIIVIRFQKPEEICLTFLLEYPINFHTGAKPTR